MFVQLRPWTAYVNVDELPAGDELYLLGLSARQIHIARSFLFPHARFPNRLVRPIGGKLYELASEAEFSAFIDDVDALADALGGVPKMLLWADTDDVADVGRVESAGVADTVARGDHVHAMPTDTAVVRLFGDQNGDTVMAGVAPNRMVIAPSTYIGVQGCETISLPNAGAIVNVFNGVYATGLLLVYGAVSSIGGMFACARGSCVALGSPAANMTNTKDTASKVNIYYETDTYVKIQNNYSSYVTLRMLWMGAGQNVLFDPAITA